MGYDIPADHHGSLPKEIKQEKQIRLYKRDEVGHLIEKLSKINPFKKVFIKPLCDPREDWQGEIIEIEDRITIIGDGVIKQGS